MYIRSHNFVGGRGNCAAFPRSDRPGFKVLPAIHFSDLQKLAARTRGRGVGQILNAVTGFNAANPCNPYPGTFSDNSCGWLCWLEGSTSGDCTPCGAVCPAGQIWDTTNNVCSANPASQAPCYSGSVIPGSAAPPPAGTVNTGSSSTPAGTCPGYCASVPFASMLFGECGVPACSSVTGSNSMGLTLALIAAGILGVAVLLKK